jgi:hypothetical protein
MHTNILCLEDVPNAERLADAAGMGVSQANSPLQAAWALAAGATDVIVVGPKAQWAKDLLAILPPASRPAVVAVGEKTRSLFGLVDRWLKPSANAAQVNDCLASALGQARQRTKSGETLLRDVETGLPSREALLGALVRKVERAQREKNELSVVITRVVGTELVRAASLLAARTRRNEITARAGADKTATLVHGSERVAEHVRARFEALLSRAGISAQTFSYPLHLGSAVADLVRVTETGWTAKGVWA